jgi:hypothetical protein
LAIAFASRQTRPPNAVTATRPRHGWSVAFTIVLSVAPHVVKSQTAPAREIRDQPTCASCDFRITPLVRIDAQEGPGIIAIANTMARDSRGRLYVTSYVFRGETKVYNPDGSYLRTLTKPGGGPGEISQGAIVQVLPGDTVYVFDSGSFRVSVFSPQHTLVRTIQVALETGAAIPVGGARMVVAAPKSVSGNYTTLHLVSSAGEVMRSFGTPSDQSLIKGDFLFWREITASRDWNGVWAASKFGNYRFERYDLSGALERQFVRTAPWFTPRADLTHWRPGVTAPPAVIAALHEDSLGRLWIITGVAKADWKRFETPDGQNQHLKFDAWLEVIDPERAVVIARQKLPVHALGFLGDDIYSYEEDEAGAPAIRIWKIELRQPAARSALSLVQKQS